MSNRPQNIALKSESLAGTVVRSSQAKQRTCLKCGRSFDSAHAGNRICKRCAPINARLFLTEEQLQKQRGVKRHRGKVISDPADEKETRPPRR